MFVYGHFVLFSSFSVCFWSNNVCIWHFVLIFEIVYCIILDLFLFIGCSVPVFVQLVFVFSNTVSFCTGL